MFFCLLSSTAFMPCFNLTVAGAGLCGAELWTAFLLSRHNSIHSSCFDPAKIFCGFDSLKICESASILRKMPGKGRSQSLWWSHFEMVGGKA